MISRSYLELVLTGLEGWGRVEEIDCQNLRSLLVDGFMIAIFRPAGWLCDTYHLVGIRAEDAKFVDGLLVVY